MKRMLDVAFSAVGLLVLSPLLALIALAIKLDSPGPVFFRQVRIGRHGKSFRLFKFRTMRHDPLPDNLQLTVGADRRITRTGQVLRQYKLDELPQLIDVLRGTMSLVGPRPEVPRWVSQYPEHRRRQILSVRPGITDVASLMFRRESERLGHAIDPEREYLEVILPEKLKVAGSYIEHSSMSSDIRVMGLTVKAILAPVFPGQLFRLWMGKWGMWVRIDRWMSQPYLARPWCAVAFDALVIVACWHSTYLFRLGFERWQPGRPWYDDLVSVGVVLVYLMTMWIFGLRRTLWRFFAFDDFRRLIWACALAGLLSAGSVLMAGLVGVSRAVLVLHPVFTVIALAMSRMIFRVVWEYAHARATGETGDRRYVIVLGANVVARRLIAGLHMRHGWHVLMLLDDDVSLHGLRIAGVPVQGGLELLRDPLLRVGATDVILALVGAEPAMQERALAVARESGLTVLMVPESADLTPVNAA